MKSDCPRTADITINDAVEVRREMVEVERDPKIGSPTQSEKRPPDSFRLSNKRPKEVLPPRIGPDFLAEVV